ncbi:hypothetical protein [Gluconobacter cerinus]|uniref:hypothetical protein n=1 Tax=Gluconobacter cerinus TaxID=38307 RepID=UPI001B8B8C61|nr:hypothetical protein [Gluconobacter cerinus]MBS1038101.1 hypothetical protein [Gluconobacter cerinus]
MRLLSEGGRYSYWIDDKTGRFWMFRDDEMITELDYDEDDFIIPMIDWNGAYHDYDMVVSDDFD